jgi:hypothetical protein
MRYGGWVGVLANAGRVGCICRFGVTKDTGRW